MQNRINSLVIISIFSIIGIIFFLSCTTKLKVIDAYFQDVKLGMKDLKIKTAFVIKFKKPVKKNFKIKEIIILGHKGFDYYYSELILSNITLNKTLLNTKNIKSFAIYLNSNDAIQKIPTKENNVHAKITYSDYTEDKYLDVKIFKDNGLKQLRNYE